MNRKPIGFSHRTAPRCHDGASRRRRAQPAEPEEDGVSGDIFASLRADIINGSLKPGARLRFIELQARYGIGTSPIREALSRLAADRLVIQEVNRGFRVPPVSLAGFRRHHASAAVARRQRRSAPRSPAATRPGKSRWCSPITASVASARAESDPEDECDPGGMGAPPSRLPHWR